LKVDGLEVAGRREMEGIVRCGECCNGP